MEKLDETEGAVLLEIIKSREKHPEHKPAAKPAKPAAKDDGKTAPLKPAVTDPECKENNADQGSKAEKPKPATEHEIPDLSKVKKEQEEKAETPKEPEEPEKKEN